ncbi:hypothetical protein HID58_080658 [Brassica napus]|uniref:Uncharacterized protein n=2 Tax=Brassica napus TaxID=3708 RepID=A0ABQ7Y5H9_BRANA|nr:hypothetical protein HID58_080658 [Brassica napus]
MVISVGTSLLLSKYHLLHSFTSKYINIRSHSLTKYPVRYNRSSSLPVCPKMALQAASLVSSAFSVRKDGTLNASSSSFKDSGLFGASITDRVKSEQSSSS